MIFHIHWCS